jgi:hypothetical protein
MSREARRALLVPGAAAPSPHMKRDMNDAIDAGAVCEAMHRPEMSFVPMNSRS